MAKPFYTDGMTVEQILELGDDVLSKMSKRDLSRALRTVSLAANKRILRLQNQAVKTNDGYEEKKNSKGISTAALNAVTNDGNSTGKFGVGKKTRNQIYAEFARARDFMSMKSSTVKGAVLVRQDAERRAFGKTREDVGVGKRQADKEIINDTFQDKVKETYKQFRKFLEEHEEATGHRGSDQVLANIGKNIMSDEMSGDEALAAANDYYDQKYHEWLNKRQTAIDNAINDGVDVGGLFDGEE